LDLLAAIGLSVPAGLNAYIPLLAIAVSERAGWLELNAPFDLLGEWWAIALIGLLLLIEVVADKVPAVDHVNDFIQTVVRPAAGGIAMVAVSGQVGRAHPILMLVAGIVLAGGVHAVKATSRPAVNTVTAGTGGWVASVAEDTAAVISSVLAIVAPVLAVVFIAVCTVLAWKVLSAGWGRLRGRPSG
jgi:hypothetical protein